MYIRNKFISIITQNNFSSNLSLQIMDIFSKILSIIRWAIISRQRKKINELAGKRPWTIPKKLLPVDMLTELLYTNLACGRIRSQFLGFSPTKHRSKSPKLWLTALIWLLVWGWIAEEYSNIVSNNFQRVSQRQLTT